MTNTRFPRSRRMAVVEDAIIPIVADLTRAYPETISLGQGVVYYPPPPEVEHYIGAMMRKPEYHRYGPIAGFDWLLEALKTKLAKRNGIRLSAQQSVFVTAGANMAFNALVLALCDTDDEMILLAPYYFNHKMTIEMCHCRAVIVPTDDDYQPIVERIADAITAKTRAVVTISPNNPSGRIYPPSTLAEINRLCAARGIYHISDEAYEDFIAEGQQHYSAGSQANTEQHTLSLFSFSKSYGLASWRVGYMVVPNTLVPAINKVQDNILICPPTVSQLAALACLEMGQTYIQKHIEQISENRIRALSVLTPLAEAGLIRTPQSDGALYVFLNLKNKLFDNTVLKDLIIKHRVAVIPGFTFGDDYQHHIRVSYGALTGEKLDTALHYLVTGLGILLK